MSIEWRFAGSYKGEYIINRIYKPGRIARFLGNTEEVTHSDVGSATIWHEYPSGERAGTFTESYLCDFVQGLKFQGKVD